MLHTYAPCGCRRQQILVTWSTYIGARYLEQKRKMTAAPLQAGNKEEHLFSHLRGVLESQNYPWVWKYPWVSENFLIRLYYPLIGETSLVQIGCRELTYSLSEGLAHLQLSGHGGGHWHQYHCTLCNVGSFSVAMVYRIYTLVLTCRDIKPSECTNCFEKSVSYCMHPFFNIRTVLGY